MIIGLKTIDTSTRILKLHILIIVSLMMSFYLKCSLILVLHNIHILHPLRFPLILLLMCLRIRCNNYFMKYAPFPSSEANYNNSLRHFRFNPFFSNNASLINNKKSLTISSNYLLLLYFHCRPHHFLSHLIRMLISSFFFLFCTTFSYALLFFYYALRMIVIWFSKALCLAYIF